MGLTFSPSINQQTGEVSCYSDFHQIFKDHSLNGIFFFLEAATKVVA
jgi:hypothetical protein